MRCAECGTRCTNVIPTTRFGGGDYRRPGRWYARQVCIPCAQEVVRVADKAAADGRRPPEKVNGMSVQTTRRALADFTATRRAS